jgi:drug/metabolite transporter (DMT)-like permease
VITAVKFLLSDSNEARTHAVSRAFGAVFDQRKVIDYALASTLYAVATLFSLLSYSKLDAGHKKILDQFRLILTAGMSSLVLGKRFSKHQWFSLLLLISAICNFYNAAIKRDQVTDLRSKCFYPQHCFGQPAADICALRVDGCQMVGNAINHRSGHINITTLPIVEAWRTDLQGLVYSLVGTTLNSLGVLFQEKVMKRDASTAFATQKAQIELAGLPIALVMCFVVPLSQGGKAIWWAENETEGSGAGFFQGFNMLALFAIFMAFCNGWMGSLILKQLSSVVQKICKCIIVVSTVLCTSTFLRPCEAPPPSIMMYVLTGMVVCTVWLFASMPSPCET